MKFHFNDGCRAAAGFKGEAGDCVVRAIAIASGQDYRAVYDVLGEQTGEFAKGRSKKAKHAAKGGATARNGVYPEVYRVYLESLGWTWVTTMAIGQGCKVHLRSEELPPGRLLVRVSRHLVAVIDGIIHDTHDCSRDGTRCVYGYFVPPSQAGGSAA